jgi:hypothetical protein
MTRAMARVAGSDQRGGLPSAATSSRARAWALVRPRPRVLRSTAINVITSPRRAISRTSSSEPTLTNSVRDSAASPICTPCSRSASKSRSGLPRAPPLDAQDRTGLECHGMVRPMCRTFRARVRAARTVEPQCLVERGRVDIPQAQFHESLARGPARSASARRHPLAIVDAREGDRAMRQHDDVEFRVVRDVLVRAPLHMHAASADDDQPRVGAKRLAQVVREQQREQTEPRRAPPRDRGLESAHPRRTPRPPRPRRRPRRCPRRSRPRRCGRGSRRGRRDRRRSARQNART